MQSATLPIDLSAEELQELGMYYFYEEEHNKAYENFKDAAALYNSEALFMLGAMFYLGRGVKQNVIQATHYFQLATQGGRSPQYKSLIYLKDDKGMKHEEVKDVHHFYLAAKNCNYDPYELGQVYEKGQGVIQNSHKAIEFYLFAAKKNHVDAQLNLATRYRIGHGVEKDIKESNRYHQLATQIPENDSFRQWIYSQPAFFGSESKKELSGNSSLLLRIQTQNRYLVRIEENLYDLIFSTKVNLFKSYIPETPPYAQNQRGPTCGLFALETALKWGNPDKHASIPNARKHYFKPTATEKLEAKIASKTSLRQIAKKLKATVMGSIYDINDLVKIAKEVGFETEIISAKGGSENNFIEKIIEAIRTQHSVILPIDHRSGFPSNEDGQHTHYALAWGYVFLNNQYFILVTHQGTHCLWSSKAIVESHDQLPDENPKSGNFYKDREKNEYPLIYEGLTVPDEDRRIVPPTKLVNFKYHFVTIPTQEKNLLILEEAKEKASAMQIVKSKNSIKLKLLFDSGATITREELDALKAEATDNKDIYSLKVLENSMRQLSSATSVIAPEKNVETSASTTSKTETQPPSALKIRH